MKKLILLAILLGACGNGDTDPEQACAPVEKFCKGQDVFICQADGINFEFVKTCEEDKECKYGECVVPCTPDCDGKTCGDDGCGTSCGECIAPETCMTGICGEPSAACEGKECGPDGEGGSCGDCVAGKKCSGAGKCEALGPPSCNGQCGTFGPDLNEDGEPDCSCFDACKAAGDCCSDFCQMCPDLPGCCEPSCGGNECGNDGCGGECGTCAEGLVCTEGTCGCAFVDCEGTCCDEGQECFEAACCDPSCEDIECGDNGCGGLCNNCLDISYDDGTTETAFGYSQQPDSKPEKIACVVRYDLPEENMKLVSFTAGWMWGLYNLEVPFELVYVAGDDMECKEGSEEAWWNELCETVPDKLVSIGNYIPLEPYTAMGLEDLGDVVFPSKTVFLAAVFTIDQYPIYVCPIDQAGNGDFAYMMSQYLGGEELVIEGTSFNDKDENDGVIPFSIRVERTE